jgi:hypothetical protein
MKYQVLIGVISLGVFSSVWGQSPIVNQNRTLSPANLQVKANHFASERNKSNSPILKSIELKKTEPSLKDISRIQKNLLQLDGGVVNGGGGDLCEDRIKTIRTDIKSWIEKRGSDDLSLPSSMTTSQYSDAMLDAISKAKITCVGPGDKNYPVEVQGAAKVCKFRGSGATSQITCDFNKFQSMTESDQYILIHHEYAGIAGIESPNGAESNYDVSNQITDYLVDQVVKRLAVKRPSDPNDVEEVSGARAVQLTEMLILALRNTSFKKSNCAYVEQTLYGVEAQCENGSRTEVRFLFTLPINAVRTQILRDPYSYACQSVTRPIPEKLFLAREGSSAVLIAKGNSYQVNDMPGYSSRYIETKYFLNLKGDKVQKVLFNVVGEIERNVGSALKPEVKRVGEVVEKHTCAGMD